MTLATRCSACGTSFRVVQDQLKVSGGWVRCGRCNEIFNALEGLYEIYTQPGELSPHAQRPDTVAAALSSPMPQPFARVPHPPASAAPGASAAPDAPRPYPSSTASHSAATASMAAPAPAESSPLPAPTPMPDSPEDVEVTLDSGQTIQMDDDDLETRVQVRTGDLGPTPSFMQHARESKAARSRRPTGLMWALGAVCLSLLAVAQLALAYRDVIGTQWRPAQPVLAQVCQVLGCRVEAPRRMAALSVEGSNLRQRGNEASYDLAVNVRNRSELTVMMPAFELTLTDTQGQPLIRRVLSGRDLAATADTIGPGAELSLQAGLDINDRRVAGYTIEIFYP
jgi:predicted Zn finger-like uncharacterized protein